MTKKKIAIVGGGITGLYLGYRLSPKHQVTIFEKENNPGGLISTMAIGPGWPIESFYHHFFTSDKALINLLKELSLPYCFAKPTTAVWQNNRLSPFSSPLDILAFPNLNFLAKIRFGLATLLLKSLPSYRLIPQNQTADDLFPKIMGSAVYQTIWQPLIKGKFGSYYDQVSAIWLWARIKTRSDRLGYPEGGFSLLTKRLRQEIISHNGQIKTGQIINQKSQLAKFDKIIFTTPGKIVNQVFPGAIKKPTSYLASLNLILVGSEPVLNGKTYWLNIADPGLPFVAVVNQTAFIDPQKYGGRHLAYIGGYYHQNDPILNKPTQEVLNEFEPFIKKINPRFRAGRYQAFLAKYPWAQPLPTLKTHSQNTSFKTGQENVYQVSMEQIFPWDRGVNYALLQVDQFLASVALDE